MITLEWPGLWMGTACVADDVPVLTLPKLRLVGLMLNVWVAATAEPLRLTELGDVGALLTIERLPDTVPADVGLNVTVTVVSCQAKTVAHTWKTKHLMIIQCTLLLLYYN